MPPVRLSLVAKKLPSIHRALRRARRCGDKRLQRLGHPRAGQLHRLLCAVFAVENARCYQTVGTVDDDGVGYEARNGSDDWDEVGADFSDQLVDGSGSDGVPANRSKHELSLISVGAAGAMGDVSGRGLP